MGKSERKKELLAAYKGRNVEGGVCLVKNTATGRSWLFSCRDVAAQRNRFQFSAMTGAPLHPAMGEDFKAHGPASFTFEVSEPLTQKPGQTDKEFQDDLNALEELWRERLRAQETEFYVN